VQPYAMTGAIHFHLTFLKDKPEALVGGGLYNLWNPVRIIASTPKP
jgi:hypothetical protein